MTASRHSRKARHPEPGRENIVYLLILAFVFVGGYVFLRYSYNISDNIPFAQEIILIVLGTVAMILITALLLNKQTAVELRKEENIKFIELKTEIYLEFFNRIEAILQQGRIDRKDYITVQFLSHKLALIASPEVLEQYHSFLEQLKRSSGDLELDMQESNLLFRELARLSARIRVDLVGEVDEHSLYSEADISEQILENTDDFISEQYRR